MKSHYKKKPEVFKDIARERITELFRQAEMRFKAHPELSDRYVELARKIAMKYKVKIPRELKRRFCKHCKKYLVPGVNCRVRLTQKNVVYSCFSCKKYIRIGYSKK